MNKDRLIYLYHCFTDRTATAAEVTEFNEALIDPELEEMIKAYIETQWNGIAPDSWSDVTAAHAAQVYNNIIKYPQEVRQIEESIPNYKSNRLWQQIGTAAAIVLIAGAGLFYFKGLRFNTEYGDSNALYKNDIAPGTNKATITLTNGKTINLSDNKTGVVIGGDHLKYSDGSFVRYTSGSQSSGSQKGEQSTTGPVSVRSLSPKLLSSQELLTARTPRGGQYQVVLADGTRVWLNAASSLKFPSVFSNSVNRVVELSGEAYFEVAKDKVHPFIVVTEQQEVKVLGTHFNISSYIDEGAVKTTLLEGAVSVTPIQTASRNDGKIIILKPNQQSVLVNNKIKVVEADAEAAIAWKSGKIIFHGERLEEIMQRVIRWYNVDVIYEGDVKNITFLGSVPRTENISALLDYFSRTGDVKFKIEGRTITVMRK